MKKVEKDYEKTRIQWKEWLWDEVVVTHTVKSFLRYNKNLSGIAGLHWKEYVSMPSFARGMSTWSASFSCEMIRTWDFV